MTNTAVMQMSGPHQGRTILVDVHEDGPFPRMIAMNTRPATSAPTGTRVKYTFQAEVGGKTQDLPVAMATKIARGLVVECRMEMN